MVRWYSSSAVSQDVPAIALRAIVFQFGLFGVAAAAVHGGRDAAIIGGSVVVVAVVVMALPWRSWTAWRWLTLRMSLLRRRRREARHHHTPVAMRVLDGALLDEVAGAGEERVGVLQRGSWWTSVCAVAPSGPGRLDGADRMLSPAALWSALSSAASAAASLRVVVHRTIGLEGVARWRTWVCLGLDAAVLGDAISGRGGGRTGMTRSLVTETARMRIDATRFGVHLEPLDSAGIAVAVHESLGVPTAHHQAGPALTESWRDCAVVGVVHRTYSQRTWPGPDGLSAVLGPGVVPSATSMTLSATVDRARYGRPRVRVLLRITARSQDWAGASAELAEHCAGTGTGWRPLDGLHLAGVLATVPAGPGR